MAAIVLRSGTALDAQENPKTLRDDALMMTTAMRQLYSTLLPGLSFCARILHLHRLDFASCATGLAVPETTKLLPESEEISATRIGAAQPLPQYRKITVRCWKTAHGCS